MKKRKSPKEKSSVPMIGILSVAAASSLIFPPTARALSSARCSYRDSQPPSSSPRVLGGAPMAPFFPVLIPFSLRLLYLSPLYRASIPCSLHAAPKDVLLLGPLPRRAPLQARSFSARPPLGSDGVPLLACPPCLLFPAGVPPVHAILPAPASVVHLLGAPPCPCFH
jgi:hypothetical protein